MAVAILSIGTELTRGEIHNTNATWLCEQVTQLGIEVTACETIPDDSQAIKDSLLRLGSSNRYILVTGGLGPTTDDITALSVAGCLGVALIRDLPSYEQIRNLVERRGRTLTESNAKQADLPAGAEALSNAHGSAPGFAIAIGQAKACFMPGVPGEMKPMFTQHLLPELKRFPTDFTACVRLKTFGAAESIVNDKLEGLEAAFDVTIGYRAHFPEVEVKVLAKRQQREVAEAAASACAAAIHEKLGNVVYGRGEDTLPYVVATLLTKRGLTLALAESCTGGLLSELLTAAPASSYFVGAVVSYANSVKLNTLGVRAETLDQYGAVSEEVVREMALGARRVLGSDCALSISGVAGPSGASETKPLGRVHLALSIGDVVLTEVATFSGNRRQVQHRAAFAALNLLRLYLEDQPLT